MTKLIAKPGGAVQNFKLKNNARNSFSKEAVQLTTVAPLHNGHLGTDQSAVVERWPPLGGRGVT